MAGGEERPPSITRKLRFTRTGLFGCQRQHGINQIAQWSRHGL